MRTKWDVLEERLRTLRKLEREMAGMERTEFGRPCAGCGEVLATEADFARHFLIPDERYLNLGRCPNE
jgi:hypothetical protein